MNFNLTDMFSATFIVAMFAVGIISTIRFLVKLIKRHIRENEEKPKCVKIKIIHLSGESNIKQVKNYFPFDASKLNVGDVVLFLDENSKEIALQFNGYEYKITSDKSYVKHYVLKEVQPNSLNTVLKR